MELNLGKTLLSCLDTPVREIQNSEQTQEIKLPDGMPDIGHILSAWGQVILRGKEWRSDSISFSGGMMVWVLYTPEDGGAGQILDAWIPFQMKWDLPEDTPEGNIRILCLPRFVDARSVSARKIMVRAGTAAMAEAYVPRTFELFAPDSIPEDVELLHSTYPVRLYREAGEKTFQMDEELTVLDSAPHPEKLVYYRLNPKLTDKRVLSNKIVFRGNGNLHILYYSEEGQLHSWDFELPFSQYAELDGEYGAEAQTDVMPMVTNLEVELDADGHLRVKAGLVAQYVVTDKQLVQLVEDAYSPDRELRVQTENLELPVVLENRWENIFGEQTIPAEANIAADVSFQPDFPRQRQTETGVEMELPGIFQVLYYGEDGILHSGTARWEGRQSLKADENSTMNVIPMAGEPQAMMGNGQILVKAEIPMEMTAATDQKFPMVTGLELGQQRIPDPDRPTLILQRAGEKRLWDIAKSSGSTMEAIRRANGLQSEPAADRMLLIPVR